MFVPLWLFNSHQQSQPGGNALALVMTRYWLAPDGVSLDIAPFVLAPEHPTGHKALAFQPAAPFFAAAKVLQNSVVGALITSATTAWLASY